MEYCYDITPKTIPLNANLLKQDTRIVTSLDDIFYDLKSEEISVIAMSAELTYVNSSAKYVVRVKKDGLLTYANSDAEFEITGSGSYR